MQFSPHDPCQALNHHIRLILQFAPEPFWRVIADRGGEKSFAQHVFNSRRAQTFEYGFERERMLLAQRDHDAVVGGGGLEFEIECAAEALA